MVWCVVLLFKCLCCFVFFVFGGMLCSAVMFCLCGLLCFVFVFVMFHWLYCCLAVCLMCVFVLSCFAVGDDSFRGFVFGLCLFVLFVFLDWRDVPIGCIVLLISGPHRN